VHVLRRLSDQQLIDAYLESIALELEEEFLLLLTEELKRRGISLEIDQGGKDQ